MALMAGLPEPPRPTSTLRLVRLAVTDMVALAAVLVAHLLLRLVMDHLVQRGQVRAAAVGDA